MQKANVQILINSGEVTKKDLNCDLCDRNCFYDENVFLDVKNNKGYCKFCYEGKEKENEKKE